MTQLLNGKEERSWFPDTEVASLMKIYRIRMSSLTGLTPVKLVLLHIDDFRTITSLIAAAKEKKTRRFNFPRI